MIIVTLTVGLAFGIGIGLLSQPEEKLITPARVGEVFAFVGCAFPAFTAKDEVLAGPASAVMMFALGLLIVAAVQCARLNREPTVLGKVHVQPISFSPGGRMR